MTKKYLIYIAFLVVLLAVPGPVNAFDITPDPELFVGSPSTVTVGKDADAIHWNIWDVNEKKYRGKGILVWAFVPDRNPIPRKSSAEIAWYKLQLKTILSALGNDKIEWIRVLQGPDALANNPELPDAVALYNFKVKGFDVFGSRLYATPVAKGRGRLLAFIISDTGWVEDASADFVRVWSARLKNFDPRDTP